VLEERDSVSFELEGIQLVSRDVLNPKIRDAIEVGEHRYPESLIEIAS
jgi:hypothetical protein